MISAGFGAVATHAWQFEGVHVFPGSHFVPVTLPVAPLQSVYVWTTLQVMVFAAGGSAEQVPHTPLMQLWPGPQLFPVQTQLAVFPVCWQRGVVPVQVVVSAQ